MCSLISINIQGVTTAFNFFKKHKYDIIFRKETHWTPDIQDSIQRAWAGPIYFNKGNDSACGIGISNFNSIIDTQMDKQGGNPTPRQYAC